MSFLLFLWLLAGVAAWLVALHKLYNELPVRWPQPVKYAVRPVPVLAVCLALGPLALVYWIAI